jgi:lipopolysaccharide export system permease protein
LRIINRYLFKEVLYALLAVTPILLLIFISNRFLSYLTDAATGKLSGDLILTLLSLKSVTVLAVVLPLVLFLSVVLALGRLYKDSEMMVLAACGVGPAQIIRIVVFPAALTLALIVGALSMYVNPWATQRAEEVEQRAEDDSDIRTIVPGRFKESRNGTGVFYAEKLSRDYERMRNVFVQSWKDDKLNILSAEHGTISIDKNGDEFMTFKDGNLYGWSPDRDEYSIIKYEKYSTRIENKAPAPIKNTREIKLTSALWGSDNPRDIAELQWRISLPLSAILLAVLAVLLARTTPRQGRYAKLFFAILIYITYNNTLSVAQSWVAHGVVSPLIGVWWVHVILLMLIGVLYVRQIGFHAIFPVRKRLAEAGLSL